MKKFVYILFLCLSISLVAVSPKVEAKSKGMDILNDLGNRVESLKSNKEYAQKKILIVVGDQKKSTTIAAFLDAVERVLSETQYHLFTLPLVMMEIQGMPVATANISGTLLSTVDTGNTVSSDQSGLAEIFIIYKGNTALPGQVLANLGTEK